MLMLYVIFFFLGSIPCCSARDTITPRDWLLNGGETLVSASKTFELGFFDSNGSHIGRYVGIWYYKSEPPKVVWVANRNNPLPLSDTPSGVFAIKEDGKLKVLDENGAIHWYSHIKSTSSLVARRVVKLMDTGNLVLSDNGTGEILWESFYNPTDTFLPGMKMNENLTLTSWLNSVDPALGNYTFKLDRDIENQYTTWENSIVRHWRSKEFIGKPDEMTDAILSLLSSNKASKNFYGDKFLPILSSWYMNTSRLVISFSGEVQYYLNPNISSPYWWVPKDRCSVSNACGKFGICSINKAFMCKCLPGFEPVSPNSWKKGEFSGGCARKSPICEKNSSDEVFLNLTMMKVRKPDNMILVYSTKKDSDPCRPICLRTCDCQAYAKTYTQNGRGVDLIDIINCLIWLDDLSGLQEGYANDTFNFYVRVALSDISRGTRTESERRTNPKLSSSSPVVVLGIITAVVLIVVGIVGYIVYLRRKTIAKRKEKRANQERYLYHRGSRLKCLIESEQFKEEDKKGIDVPLFDLEDILAGTNNFSNANKLGQGGFGPVYKGKFPEGQEMAVKRLSRGSRQGLQEFKNEVVLIAKLQHRNLVRLLGYCVEGDERILLYEYMPNKSLDSFIFDGTLCMLLNWESRFNIILGIARGLIYLHQDSRLKIIHRDLKTSNILLDEDMNPKISDFGLARIFESKQTEANTNRVVGTYGYMSPEYALDGVLSIKSDVYSFGVVVLEIISGKKNTGFYQSDQVMGLLGYAWNLLVENKVYDLMDPTVSETCNTSEFLRCVNVGLLCVQQDPSDRPTMSNAFLMLNNEIATLPVPQPPLFCVRTPPPSPPTLASSFPTINPKACSNEITFSLEEGR